MSHQISYKDKDWQGNHFETVLQVILWQWASRVGLINFCLVNGLNATLIPPRRSFFFLRNCYNFIEMVHFTVRAWILSRISSLTTNFSSIKLCKKFVSLNTFFYVSKYRFWRRSMLRICCVSTNVASK